MQEFYLDKKYISLMKWCLIGFIVFLVFGLALPFLPDDEKGNLHGTLFVTLMCTVVFGSFSVLTWLTLRKLPYTDVATDDEGIWYMHAGKGNSLIPWGKITKVKERVYMQCLDLMGSNGEKLLRVEYLLNGFDVLRDIITEKTFNTNSAVNCSEFSTGPFHHLFYLASILGFSALGVYVASDGSPILGYGAMSVLVIFITYEYFFTATGVAINDSKFVIAYSFTSRNVSFSDVVDIRLVDEFHKGSRIPEVWIILKNGKKPFKLKRIGADSNTIYKVLRKAANLSKVSTLT